MLQTYWEYGKFEGLLVLLLTQVYLITRDLGPGIYNPKVQEQSFRRARRGISSTLVVPTLVFGLVTKVKVMTHDDTWNAKNNKLNTSSLFLKFLAKVYNCT